MPAMRTQRVKVATAKAFSKKQRAIYYNRNYLKNLSKNLHRIFIVLHLRTNKLTTSYEKIIPFFVSMWQHSGG